MLRSSYEIFERFPFRIAHLGVHIAHKKYVVDFLEIESDKVRPRSTLMPIRRKILRISVVSDSSLLDPPRAGMQ